MRLLKLGMLKINGPIFRVSAHRRKAFGDDQLEDRQPAKIAQLQPVKRVTTRAARRRRRNLLP